MRYAITVLDAVYLGDVQSILGRGCELEEAKRRLFDHLRQEVGNERVIAAMERVPREAFVPASDVSMAYEDVPLPIGEGQTISQPFIVAYMVSALELRRSDKVLEIGTGSGYQAAILAELSGRVITVERIETLANSARQKLASLGCANIEVHQAGDELGWPREAPYNAIIVAAAAPTLPRDVMEQLAVGGRLVVPVGSLENQDLMKVTKTQGGYSVQTLGQCRFVPLIGDRAWPQDRGQE